MGWHAHSGIFLLFSFDEISYLITVITVGMETQPLSASYCTARSPLKCLPWEQLLHMADVFVLFDQISWSGS